MIIIFNFIGMQLLYNIVLVSAAAAAAAKSLQSCPILSDPMDCSLPGSSVHEIFQARVLEWGAIALYSPVFVKNHFEIK